MHNLITLLAKPSLFISTALKPADDPNNHITYSHPYTRTHTILFCGIRVILHPSWLWHFLFLALFFDAIVLPDFSHNAKIPHKTTKQAGKYIPLGIINDIHWVLMVLIVFIILMGDFFNVYLPSHGKYLLLFLNHECESVQIGRKKHRRKYI